MNESDFDPNWVCSFGVVNCPICRAPRAKGASTLTATKASVATIARAVGMGTVRISISVTGQPTFAGLSQAERGGLTDIEIYRNVMVNGSTIAKAAIARAEQLAGRQVKDRARHVTQQASSATRATVRS